MKSLINCKEERKPLILNRILVRRFCFLSLSRYTQVELSPMWAIHKPSLLCSLPGGQPHLRDAGHAAGLPLQGALLTHGQQIAGEDGAKVIEGTPPNTFQLLRDSEGMRRDFGKEFWEERLFCVAITSKCSWDSNQAWDCIFAEVF